MSSLFLSRQTFQWYLYKSDTAIFAWMDTWNYTFSPFKAPLKGKKLHTSNSVSSQNKYKILFNVFDDTLKSCFFFTCLQRFRVFVIL